MKNYVIKFIVVLGYLKDENLDEAYYKFCKTSPYLKKTFTFIKQGYVPVNTNKSLQDLLKSYFEIQSTSELKYKLVWYNVINSQFLLFQSTNSFLYDHSGMILLFNLKIM